MINDKTIARIISFLHTAYATKNDDISIYRNDDGSYDFFDRYIIVDHGAKVTVEIKYNYGTHEFSSLKNAVTWCIFEKQNKIMITKRIASLDSMISSVEAEIAIHKGMVKRSKIPDSTLIWLAKLNEEQRSRTAMVNELDGYIRESKNWQSKKFAMKR
tara:strand:+ start:1389 stop:1862 length:474 start_codon:yes stop_codon:yes gene_type:complete